MMQADYPEKRVSSADDRRGRLGGGGRRAEDHLASQFSTMVPCRLCDVSWAALSSVAVERGGPWRPTSVRDVVMSKKRLGAGYRNEKMKSLQPIA